MDPSRTATSRKQGRDRKQVNELIVSTTPRKSDNPSSSDPRDADLKPKVPSSSKKSAGTTKKTTLRDSQEKEGPSDDMKKRLTELKRKKEEDRQQYRRVLTEKRENEEKRKLEEETRLIREQQLAEQEAKKIALDSKDELSDETKQMLLRFLISLLSGSGVAEKSLNRVTELDLLFQIEIGRSVFASALCEILDQLPSCCLSEDSFEILLILLYRFLPLLDVSKYKRDAETGKLIMNAATRLYREENQGNTQFLQAYLTDFPLWNDPTFWEYCFWQELDELVQRNSLIAKTLGLKSDNKDPQLVQKPEPATIASQLWSYSYNMLNWKLKNSFIESFIQNISTKLELGIETESALLEMLHSFSSASSSSETDMPKRTLRTYSSIIAPIYKPVAPKNNPTDGPEDSHQSATQIIEQVTKGVSDEAQTLEKHDASDNGGSQSVKEENSNIHNNTDKNENNKTDDAKDAGDKEEGVKTEENKKDATSSQESKEEDGDADKSASMIAGKPRARTITQKEGNMIRDMVKVSEASRIQEVEFAKRSEILKEILNTERFYVECLESVLRDYKTPLMESLDDLSITEMQVKIIFGNIEDIEKLNKMFLVQLSARYATWKDLPARDHHIGSLLIQIFPFMKIYADYCASFTASADLVIQLYREKPKFAEFFNNVLAKDTGKKLDLQSYLIMPVQRVPRYKLLLQELLKVTPQQSPDHKNIVMALKVISDVANFCNSNQRDEMNKLVEIQMLLGARAPNLIEPSRVLVKEGVATVVVSIPSLTGGVTFQLGTLYIYLFSDLIVYCKSKSKYLGKMKLLTTWIREVPDSKQKEFKNMFQLYSIDPDSLSAEDAVSNRRAATTMDVGEEGELNLEDEMIENGILPRQAHSSNAPTNSTGGANQLIGANHNGGNNAVAKGTGWVLTIATESVEAKYTWIKEIALTIDSLLRKISGHPHVEVRKEITQRAVGLTDISEEKAVQMFLPDNFEIDIHNQPFSLAEYNKTGYFVSVLNATNEKKLREREKNKEKMRKKKNRESMLVTMPSEERGGEGTTLDSKEKLIKEATEKFGKSSSLRAKGTSGRGKINRESIINMFNSTNNGSNGNLPIEAANSNKEIVTKDKAGSGDEEMWEEELTEAEQREDLAREKDKREREERERKEKEKAREKKQPAAERKAPEKQSIWKKGFGFSTMKRTEEKKEPAQPSAANGVSVNGGEGIGSSGVSTTAKKEAPVTRGKKGGQKFTTIFGFK